MDEPHTENTALPWEPETCTCGRAGELVVGNYGLARNRCRPCGKSWVTVGSPMDVMNELIFVNTPELNKEEN